VKEEEPDLAAALDAFIKKFSYPAEQGLLIRNLSGHPVHARADRGNAAAYFSFPEIKNLEAHVSEIPPGGATRTHRHTCEALFYVLSGNGYTAVRASSRLVLHADLRMASPRESRFLAACSISRDHDYSTYEITR
jgi:Auxin binding protein